MKKTFETPEVNVVPFTVEDIITTSGTDRPGELPDV